MRQYYIRYKYYPLDGLSSAVKREFVTTDDLAEWTKREEERTESEIYFLEIVYLGRQD